MSDAEDAARYRWLKSIQRLGQWRIQRWEEDPEGGSFFDTVNNAELDERIDEDRAASQTTGAQ